MSGAMVAMALFAASAGARPRGHRVLLPQANENQTLSQATLPLYEGLSNVKKVYFVITDASTHVQPRSGIAPTTLRSSQSRQTAPRSSTSGSCAARLASRGPSTSARTGLGSPGFSHTPAGARSVMRRHREIDHRLARKICQDLELSPERPADTRDRVPVSVERHRHPMARLIRHLSTRVLTGESSS